jgi:glucosyl-dolichyl phosphate glucuronosyltransferase
MKITVILCTYNRCQNLAKTLESLAQSALPDTVECEILVVDNNSTDQTRYVFEELARRYDGRFRYLFEPQQGKSYALNSGIHAASGEILAFTDDDITADKDWLWNLTAQLRDGKWAGAGGRVVPVWICAAPNWFPVEHPWGPIVEFDLGLEPGVLTEAPIGANMAFRKEVFEKYGGFRTDLGRCGDSLISSEDLEFGRRLLSAGERLRYEPSSIVYHPVPENRLTKNYILTWWFDKARSDVRENRASSSTTVRVAGVPIQLFPKLAFWLARWMISIGPARRFDAKLTLWNIAGAVKEHHKQSRPSNGH